MLVRANANEQLVGGSWYAAIRLDGGCYSGGVATIIMVRLDVWMND